MADILFKRRKIFETAQRFMASLSVYQKNRLLNLASPIALQDGESTPEKILGNFIMAYIAHYENVNPSNSLINVPITEDDTMALYIIGKKVLSSAEAYDTWVGNGLRLIKSDVTDHRRGR